jgi:hypothetical protein
VIRYLVSQRISEIAIRIALGAGRGASSELFLEPPPPGGRRVGPWIRLGLLTRNTVRSLSINLVEASP